MLGVAKKRGMRGLFSPTWIRMRRRGGGGVRLKSLDENFCKTGLLSCSGGTRYFMLWRSTIKKNEVLYSTVQYTQAFFGLDAKNETLFLVPVCANNNGKTKDNENSTLTTSSRIFLFPFLLLPFFISLFIFLAFMAPDFMGKQEGGREGGGKTE